MKRFCMILALAGSAAAGIQGAFAADVPRDPEAFTGFVVTKLQPEISTVPVSAAGPLSITIGPISSNISHLYDVCQANPAGCDEAIHQTGMQARQVLGVRSGNGPDQ